MKKIFHTKKFYMKPMRICCNKRIFKARTKIAVGIIGILSVMSGICASNIVASQVSADANTIFKVNIAETLSVAVTIPKSGASGSAGTFLRNAVNLNVSSTNVNGFTATMYTSNNTTNLINTRDSSKTIQTLSGTSTRSNFPSNRWGYSLDDTTTGSESSNYSPLVSTSASPIEVLKSDTDANNVSKDIYFGTKADLSQASGTYSGTVVISVVSDVIDEDNPVTPTDPVTPSDNDSTNPSYSGAGTTKGHGTNGTTSYTTSTNNDDDTTTTTTEVSDGNTVDAYADPAGVTERTTANINGGTPLAIGLAVSAAVAATSGMFFFILAKRRKDDDDEEEEEL